MINDNHLFSSILKILPIHGNGDVVKRESVLLYNSARYA